jgi:hypothetical protein
MSFSRVGFQRDVSKILGGNSKEPKCPNVNLALIKFYCVRSTTAISAVSEIL